MSPRARNHARRLSGRTVGVGLAALAAGAALAAANYAAARRAERRHPPRGRFLEVDGVRLHCIEAGSGSPPVVLLHGNGTMAEDYALSGVLGLAARSHRVVAFDRPGFGYSDRPRGRIWTARAQGELLAKALRRLDLRRPVLVGHSWGTMVALSMALEAPREIGALVLLSGYYAPTARADVALMSWPAVPGLGDVLRYTVSPLLGRLLLPRLVRKSFAPSPVTERFRAGFPAGLALRPWQLRASAADTALMIPEAARLAQRRGELAVPLVIVAGAGDRIVDTARQSVALHRDVPGSLLRTIPGAGHMIHHIAPERVAEAIETAAGLARAQAGEGQEAGEILLAP